jgi:hypothetical protein
MSLMIYKTGLLLIDANKIRVALAGAGGLGLLEGQERNFNEIAQLQTAANRYLMKYLSTELFYA